MLHLVSLIYTSVTEGGSVVKKNQPPVQSRVPYLVQEGPLTFLPKKKTRPPGEENGNPSQYSCLKNPMNRGAEYTSYSPRGSKELGEDLATQQQ